MALETATYINGLVEANPLGSDPLSDADGHLRLIKSTLKATFPNITGAVTLTQAQLNSPFPTGGIILWSGAITDVPTGWVLCNGANGTPNLRDRFVVGAGTSYAVGATGGAATVSLTVANMPSHNHGGDTDSASVPHTHSFSATTGSSGAHTHNYYSGSFGSAFTAFPNDEGGGGTQSYTYTTASAGSHTHTVSGSTATSSATSHVHVIDFEGSGTAHENRPPYYALAYIMKI